MTKEKQKKGYVSPTKSVLGRVIIGILVFAMIAGILFGLGAGIWQLISKV